MDSADLSVGGQEGAGVRLGGPRRTAGSVVALLAVGALLASPATAQPGFPTLPADPPTPSQQEVEQAQSQAQTAANAVGSAEARLAQLRTLLADLNRRAEQASEAYNGARYELTQARAIATAAEQRASSARSSWQFRQAELGQLVRMAYINSGRLAPADYLVGADGPAGAIARSATVDDVMSRLREASEQADAAKIVADLLGQQAEQALGAQQAATRKVAESKLAAKRAVRAQRDRVAGLQQEIDQLAAQLAHARSHAHNVAHARTVGLAREAAAREAARKAAAEAAERKAAEQAAARAAARRAAEAAAAAAADNDDDSDSSNGDSSGNGGGSSTGGGTSSGGTSHGTEQGAAAAVDFAQRQLGKPYVYAAAGPETFDCSGLTMRAWEAGGVSLPHWSVAQYLQSESVSSAEARPGDLVFFGTDPGNPMSIYHVGLYIGGGMMIHAPHTGDVVRVAAVYATELFGYARP